MQIEDQTENGRLLGFEFMESKSVIFLLLPSPYYPENKLPNRNVEGILVDTGSYGAANVDEIVPPHQQA